MDFSAKMRASRAILGWNQQDLAIRTKLSKKTIYNVENGDTTPDTQTVRHIKQAFEREGLYFVENGVEQKKVFITTYSDYLDILSDIENTIDPQEEVLFHCADDSRSSDEVNRKLRELKEKGYRYRSTICEGNTMILGDLKEYRWIPRDYFSDSPISVIYGSRYARHVPPSDLSGEHLFIVTNSQGDADVQRKQFEYWWKKGKKVGSE